MITVMIQARDDGEALSRTLIPLVEGAMDGVVSTVMVFSIENALKSEIDRICDLSGADHYSAFDISEAIPTAKDKWLLILEAGARLEGDWLSGVVSHINQTEHLGRFALAARKPRKNWWQRLWSRAPNSALRYGCLMPKTVAIMAAKNAPDLHALARGRAMKTIQSGYLNPAA